jgi:hypothetical protein
MAIALDAVSSDICGFDGSRTIPHVLGAGTNRVLVAMGAANGNTDKVTSVTFNGVAMTRAIAATGLAITANFIYVLPISDALAAGTYNVVWTFNSGDVAMEFRHASFTGVSATTPFDDAQSYSNGFAASPVSITMTPSVGGMVIGLMGGSDNATAFTPGTGQIEIGSQSSTIPVRVCATYKSGATAMSYSWTGDTRQGSNTAIALVAAAAGDTTAPTLSSPTSASTGSTTGSCSVTTIEATGTLYYLASVNATETATTVKASGATQAVTATGSQAVTVSGLTASTTYYLHYVHRDAAGNDSTVANSAAFVTAASSDSTAPTMNGTIAVSAITSSGFTLTWIAATDTVGVTGYQVACDVGGSPTYVDVGNVLTITETGKAASTLYNVKVRAYDAAGNFATPLTTTATTSASSSTGTITTKAICNNTGTNWADLGITGVTSFSIHNAATDALVLRKTGLTLNGSSILVVADAAYVPGTTYWMRMVLSNGAVAMDTVTAT